MKTYSIGRDNSCDIVINDNTDVISRRHALLQVSSSGKMTIVDQSTNGTYVNGIRISPNVPFPVSRKDTISLAHIAKLDWALVPTSQTWLTYSLMALGAIIVVSALTYGAFYWFNAPAPQSFEPAPVAPADTTKKDTCAIVKSDTIKQVVPKDSIPVDTVSKKTPEPTSKPAAKSKHKASPAPAPAQKSEPESTHKQDVG